LIVDNHRIIYEYKKMSSIGYLSHETNLQPLSPQSWGVALPTVLLLVELPWLAVLVFMLVLLRSSGSRQWRVWGVVFGACLLVLPVVVVLLLLRSSSGV
jgi:hypothetical protein